MKRQPSKNDNPQPSQSQPQQEPQAATRPLAAVRRRRKQVRIAILLLVLAVLVYLVVQVFILFAPRMRTEIARLHTMTETLQVQGGVFMQSIEVGGGEGYLYYTVDPGHRVTAGSEVALLFSSEEAVEAMSLVVAINRELELLSEAQRTVSDGGDIDALLQDMQTGLYSLMDQIETGNYESLVDIKYNIALAGNKIQISAGDEPNFEARIAQLTELRNQYSAMAVPIGNITAPQAGYFVPAARDDRVQLDYDTAASATAQQLQQILQEPPVYYGSEVAGHIITDYRWHFVAVVNAEEAGNFTVGSSNLSLSFTSTGDMQVPVTVEAIRPDEQGDMAVLEFSSEYISPQLLSLRVEEAEIVLGEQQGIRLEKNALRLVDVENDDGSVSTYQGVYVKLGNMVYFRRVEVLLEDEYYILIPDEVTAGVNEVALYDEVVVDAGGVVLYDRKIL